MKFQDTYRTRRDEDLLEEAVSRAYRVERHLPRQLVELLERLRAKGRGSSE